MTIQDLLSKSTKRLEKAGIGTARLDALILLEDATGKDRAWLLAHLEFTVRGPTLRKLDTWIKQRVMHEPLAYIRGKTEFYGREFIINQDVLEPRSESETMIDLLKVLVNHESRITNHELRVLDVGTGSGALAVTAKLELPEAEVVATDIDPKCLKVARQNARKHSVKIDFYKGNLLQPTYNLEPMTHNLILANLPYVPDSYGVNKAAMNEPRQAIFGGADGLDLYRQLFSQLNHLPTNTQKSRTKKPQPHYQIANYLQFDSGDQSDNAHKVEGFVVRPKYVLTESLPFQHKELEKTARSASYKLQKSADFIQVFSLINS